MRAFRLTELLHASGINVRYLGLVYGHVSVEAYRTFVLAEMCARIIKNDLRLEEWRGEFCLGSRSLTAFALSRSRMRTVMRASPLPRDEPFRVVACATLNLAFGRSVEARSYWAQCVVPQMAAQFYLSQPASARPWRELLWTPAESLDFRLVMLDRILSSTGMVVDPDLLNFLRTGDCTPITSVLSTSHGTSFADATAFDAPLLFDGTDIIELGERVKVRE